MASSQKERECLTQLAAGVDAWPQFWSIFGGLIMWELGRFEIAQGALRDDFFQELALKLMRSNFSVIRRHLAEPRVESFGPLLRVIVRHLVISHLRRSFVKLECELASDGDGTRLKADQSWARDPAVAEEDRRAVVQLIRQTVGEGEDSVPFRIMYLRFVDRESVSSIAARFGLTPNAVSQRIWYFSTKLRKAKATRVAEQDDD